MKTILIVDDENEIIENISYDIRDMNLKVISASNGKEALLKAKNNQIDFIFTDINMPLIDGLTLIKKLSRIGVNVPIVFLSAEWESRFLPLDEYETQSIIFKSHAILKKPYEVKQIRELLFKGLNLKSI